MYQSEALYSIKFIIRKGYNFIRIISINEVLFANNFKMKYFNNIRNFNIYYVPNFQINVVFKKHLEKLWSIKLGV